MSPKRKKVEAALKNLFSNPNAPKSNQEAAGESVSETNQQPVNSAIEFTEKPAAKPRSSRQKATSAVKTKPAVKSEAPVPVVKQAKTEKSTTPVMEKVQEEPDASVLVESPAKVLTNPKITPVSSAPTQKPSEPQTTTEKAKQADQDAKPANEPKKENKKILDETQLVIFKLADEYYGVKIGEVESIIKMQPFTIVPNVPNYIVGVTNLRGYVLPIVDLRTRFNLPTQEETHNTRVMVLLINGEKVGMIVDEVNEVARVLTDDIDPTPALIVNINMEFADGIAKLRDEKHEIMRMAILLNMEKVLKIK